MISVYVHKKKFNIVLAWECYSKTRSKGPFSVSYFNYIGVALENRHGVTCVFPDSALDEFEYIGEL